MEHLHEREWPQAVRLLVRWLEGRQHLDDLLERARLGHSRWLVMETFRQWWSVERILSARLRREPRPLVYSLLRLAVTELLSREAEVAPRVVHHAVEVARQLGLSGPERGFVNGVLRGLLRDPDGLSKVELLDSHPEWMVSRWTRQFGPAGTHSLLEWNQSRPELMIRMPVCPGYAEQTEWEGFFRILPGQFPEAEADLVSGRAYVQDPFTMIPVELLAPQPGERILDLCAAPGGKSRLIAQRLGGSGRILAVDKPGARLQRLRENVDRLADNSVMVLGCPLEALEPGKFPEAFGRDRADCLLLDVPCSNTGVIRKRPDVKVRLAEEDIARIAAYQFVLLERAASMVRPGGRLVYSTCSLEVEENEGVVTRFSQSHPEWRQRAHELSQPWACRHDGGGAFLLTRDLPG